MHTHRYYASLVMAATAVTALTGCSTPNLEGPLYAGSGSNELCFRPAPEGTGMRAVGEVVRNDGEKPVTIRQIGLANPKGLALEDTYLIPLTEDDRFSFGVNETESEDEQTREHWARAIEPKDFVLQPGAAANIVAAVSISSEIAEGTASALEVQYTDGRTDFLSRTTTTLLSTNSSCFS